MADGGGASDEPAIGYGFSDSGKDLSIFENVVGVDGGSSFFERDVIGIDKAQLCEAEVAHGARHGSYIERIARRDQNDPQRITARDTYILAGPLRRT